MNRYYLCSPRWHDSCERPKHTRQCSCTRLFHVHFQKSHYDSYNYTNRSCLRRPRWTSNREYQESIRQHCCKYAHLRHTPVYTDKYMIPSCWDSCLQHCSRGKNSHTHQYLAQHKVKKEFRRKMKISNFLGWAFGKGVVMKKKKSNGLNWRKIIVEISPQS